jgi:hypothetical protein
VPKVGVEPTRPLRTQDFESSASAIPPLRLEDNGEVYLFRRCEQVLQQNPADRPLQDAAILVLENRELASRSARHPANTASSSCPPLKRND